MTDITDLLPPKKTVVATPQRLPVRAVITTPPETLDAPTMRIVAPGHSSDYDAECRWVRQGDAIPGAGVDCLVVYDETGAGTVVAWEGAGVLLLPVVPTPVSVFANSWVNFDTDRPARYSLDRGWVSLTGIIKSGTIGAVTAFTLPLGYRPTSVNGLVFPVVSNGAFGRADVFSTGAVQAVTGSNVYFSLDGIRFPVN